MDRPQRLAERQEIRSAAYWGGRRVPKSGSGDQKGDIETASLLVECKHTDRRSYGMRPGEFDRLRTWAIIAHRMPVQEIEFTTPEGRHAQYLVVADRDDLKALLDENAQLWAKIKADC